MIFGASTFPQNLTLEKDGFQNFGGSRRAGGFLGSNRPPPLGCNFLVQDPGTQLRQHFCVDLEKPWLSLTLTPGSRHTRQVLHPDC